MITIIAEAAKFVKEVKLRTTRGESKILEDEKEKKRARKLLIFYLN
jgi:hypothetical protein